MQTQSCTTFTEEQKLTDLLSSQKYLTGVYNTYWCESSTGAVKNCLSSILQDEHRIQEEIFDVMNARGNYPQEKAEMNKLDSTKQKFSSSVTK